MELKHKIEESEHTLKTVNQKGPLVAAFAGIVVCLTLVLGLNVGFLGIGFIMVLSAVVRAYCKTREAVKQKEAIFLYKMEIYRIEKKP